MSRLTIGHCEVCPKCTSQDFTYIKTEQKTMTTPSGMAVTTSFTDKQCGICELTVTEIVTAQQVDYEPNKLESPARYGT